MNKKQMPRNIFLFTALTGFLLMAGVFTFAVEGTYVGNEKCKECHENEVASFNKSMHSRAWSAKGGGSGCESCHGPAGEHLKNPSKETIIAFGKKSGNSADARSKQCLECHSATTNVAMWDSGQHKKNDVACTSCHSVHKDGSPTAKQPETCFTCHTDIRYQANKQSHHPIIEGKVKCSDCHNPHGSITHGMLKADSVNQLCYKCHADKRGPYLFEHPPVEENCLACHDSHGTKASKLLKDRPPNLCQDCHDAQRHPGTPYDAKSAFLGTAKSNKFYGRACLNCHGAIHGSNAPENPADTSNSGRYFLR